MTDREPPIARGSLSATELASAATCETRVVLTRRLGKRSTRQQAVRQAQGDAHHQAFHRATTEHHNSGSGTRKGPCFIATCVYGSEHASTWRLRRFRDGVLRPHWFGRQVIAAYYATSPHLVRWLDSHPRAKDGVRHTLDCFIAIVHRKEQA